MRHIKFKVYAFFTLLALAMAGCSGGGGNSGDDTNLGWITLTTPTSESTYFIYSNDSSYVLSLDGHTFASEYDEEHSGWYYDQYGRKRTYYYVTPAAEVSVINQVTGDSVVASMTGPISNSSNVMDTYWQWDAEIPIVTGANNIQINVSDGHGNEASITLDVTLGPLPYSPDNAESLENNASDSISPQIVADNDGNVIVIWVQNYDSIWSTRYLPDIGWEGAQLVDQNDIGYTQTPRLAIDGHGNATAVWLKSNDVAVSQHQDLNGWNSAELLESWHSGPCSNPDISVAESGYAIASWQCTDYSSPQNFSRLFIPGSGWQAEETLNLNSLFNDGKAMFGISNQGDAIALWLSQPGYDLAPDLYADHYSLAQGWTKRYLIESGDNWDNWIREPRIFVDGIGNAIAAWTGVPTHWNCYVDETEWLGAQDSVPQEECPYNRFAGAPNCKADCVAKIVQYSQSSEIATNRDGISVRVWLDSITQDILASWLFPNSDWTEPPTVVATGDLSPSDVEVAIDGYGNVSIVWLQSNGGRTQVWARRYLYQ